MVCCDTRVHTPRSTSTARHRLGPFPLSERFKTVNCKLSTVNCPYGFAVGEKNPIGKSFAVRSPAGASRITGIEFTATDAVAMSP